jgi:hypothetical protein
MAASRAAREWIPVAALGWVGVTNRWKRSWRWMASRMALLLLAPASDGPPPPRLCPPTPVVSRLRRRRRRLWRPCRPAALSLPLPAAPPSTAAARASSPGTGRHPRCGVSSQVRCVQPGAAQSVSRRGKEERADGGRGRGGGGGGGVTRHATQCAHSLSHRCGGRCGVRSWSSRRRCWCHRRLRSTSASPRYAAPPAPPSSMPAMCAAITRYDGRCGAVRSRQPTATHPAHVR